uniref:Uncharacterized protein n=1 Tax=Latimeria chalumnae TaxID=7897 RepID=H3AK55_LATCH
KGQPDSADVDLLVSELINVFVTVLQKNSRASWLFLHDVFVLLQPFCNHLRGKEDLLRHLEAIYYQYQTNQAMISDIDILGTMDKAFPKDSSLLYQGVRGSTKKAVKMPPQLKPLLVEQLQLAPVPAFSGQPCPFVLERAGETAEEFFQPAPLTLDDLQKSVALVGSEVAREEMLWMSNLGHMPLILGVNMGVQFRPLGSWADSEETERVTKDTMPKLGVEGQLGTGRRSTDQPLTGRRTAEELIKNRHLEQIKFLYLNIRPSRYFRPYDLTVVPKENVNAEHYVFSPFGVLHVYSDHSSEAMTLGEWHQEAIIWRTLQEIPFFRNYLLKKAFTCWSKNVRHQVLLKRWELLENQLLPTIPHFGATLLLGFLRLSQELKCIHWFPQDLSQCCTLMEFQQTLNKKNMEARELLDKFFSFCSLVLQLV